MTTSHSSLFARITTVIMLLACLAVAFWVISQALEPVAVPPSPPAKAQVRFDPRVDVSQNTVFQRLEPLGPAIIEPGKMGRTNPFVPLPVMSVATSSAVTTTTPVVPLPPN